MASVLPITAIVFLLSVTIAPLEPGTLVLFLFGAVLLVIGMGFFTLGVDMSMLPMGEGVGAVLSGKKRLLIPVLLYFLLGVLSTMAEPDLTVLANQISAIPNMVLILTVAVGVGLFLVVATLRVRWGVPLRRLLLLFYGVVFLLAVFCRRCAARGETPLSPVFAAWGALLVVGYFAVTAEQLLSAARVLFEGVFSPLLLLLVLLGAAWAAAAAGQEALGRAAFVSLFLFLLAVLLLTFGVLPQATALNLRLPEEDLSRLGEEILFILPRQIEPLLLLLFAQRCSRPRSAALLLWVPAGWLLGGLLLLLAALVLGHYGSLQPYPMMQLARSAGLSGMVPVYCFLLITAAFFRLTGLAVAAARLGGMAGCRPKYSLWAGVALSLGGVALLHYTGWPDAAVYPILAVTGLLWLIFALLPPRGTGNKRDRRR